MMNIKILLTLIIIAIPTMGCTDELPPGGIPGVGTNTTVKNTDTYIGSYAFSHQTVSGSVVYFPKTNTVTISKDSTANVVDERICLHEWVYSPVVLMSNPPVYEKICRLCGKTEIDHGAYSAANEEYFVLQEKFKKGDN